MRIKLLLIFICLYGCKRQFSDDLKFDVVPHLSYSEAYKDIDYVSYKFIISSSDTLDFIIDWKAFSNICNYEEADNLIIRCSKDLSCIHDSIKFSQFIVENEQGEMHFLSDAKMIEGKIYPANDINCMTDWFMEYSVLPSKSLTIESPKLFFDYIGIELKSQRIRLHYLFKPNPQQLQNGYERVMLSSQWFNHL